MSEPKRDATDLMMALLAGQSGEHASKGWERQKLENDIAWLGSELTRMKAEVERLDTLCKQLMAQHSDISCENIMLRKAGDAMQDDLKIQVWPWASQFKSIKHWNAAKEGKGQP